MRWRSAVVSFGGLAAIVSVAGAVAFGDAFGDAVDCARGGVADGAAPMSQFVRLVDGDFPCPPPSNPNVWSNR